jgi:hypothetical protein
MKKPETTPPKPVTDQYAADLAAAKRLADEVFREAFAVPRMETIH